MTNFWKKLKKPIFALAPMHEVSDAAFRQTVAHYRKPDVMFSEFVAVEALCNEKSKEKITGFFLKYKESERPLVAQIWGSDPEKFRQAAIYIKSLKFDGIDINMGCPSKNIVKLGGGAALIQNPKLAAEIIKTTKEGADNLPVSVKTRIGFEKINTEKWIGELLEANPAVITVHGRTKKELSGVPAHWDEIGKAAGLARGSGTLILGNGDVKTRKDGEELAKQYGLDGIMVGRATLGNPWFFDLKVDYDSISVEEKIEAMLFHVQLFEKNFNKVKKLDRFKKFIKGYISGFDGAGELRSKLMVARNSKEVKEKIKYWKSKNKN